MKTQGFRLRKYVNYIIKRSIYVLCVLPKIIKYRLLSDCERIDGSPNRISPVIIKGKGVVSFGDNVNMGVIDSPHYYSSYIYIDARNISSNIKFGDNVYINNNASFISEGPGIAIGNNTLIGTNFTVFDSDFHEIDPLKRIQGTPKMSHVCIKDNVFVGSDVTILKGVTIGENSIIASCSVVTKSIPANVIAGGNPCRILRDL